LKEVIDNNHAKVMYNFDCTKNIQKIAGQPHQNLSQNIHQTLDISKICITFANAF
jgi:hypothetical protein